ncbi:MAG: PKD domain-containing protein [Bacteroidia bacterium]
MENGVSKMQVCRMVMSKGKHLLKLLVLATLFLTNLSVNAQSNSNKGKDFWVGFMAHRDGTSAGMYLYITSDSNTSGTVSIPGKSWSTTFTVTANAMTLVAIPSSQAYVGCSDCITGQGIHVTSQKPIVVYSHFTTNYCSDATLVLPTPATGKEYFCMAYEQLQNTARSQFMIIANKDNTKVKITPTAVLTGSSGDIAKGTPYYITLNAGEVYQGRAKTYGATQDVTGTHIEVIDTGSTSNCRTVAVFSGSSDTYILCTGASTGGLNSRDNLYQQMYPTQSWGNQFITIPFKNRTVDHIRVVAAEDATTVTMLNETGTPTSYYLAKAGDFQDIRDVSTTKYFLATKPIMVAQYQTSQKCGGKGDPSMTILSPLEQTLKNITVYSSEYEDIIDHYINVIMPTAYTSTFKIDGSSATFTPVPKKNSYSYAQIKVTKGNHQLKADVGFLAIAYGFGDYESYGYSAGANVKDLTAQIKLKNSAQNEVNSVCLGQAAKFEGKAEYTVTKWEWFFGDGTKDTIQNTEHTYKDTGDYIVWLRTYKDLFDGCSVYDSTPMEVRVNGVPTAKLATSHRCEQHVVNFTDSSTVPGGETILNRQWIFHTGTPVYQTNTSKYYDTAGVYNVKLITKTTFQCADTLSYDMVISPLPKPGFMADDVCFKESTIFTDTSKVKTGSIAQYKWYFGDGDSSSTKSPNHFYQDSGTFFVDLIATTDSGCFASVRDTVVKHPFFNIDFKYNDTCTGMTVNFTNTSTSVKYALQNFEWKFSDGSYFTTKNVQHIFGNTGSYDVWLIGHQDTFCVDSVKHTVAADPNVVADFDITGKCLHDTIFYTNKSTVSSGNIANYTWTLADGFTSTQKDPKQKYTTKGTKNIRLIATSDKGCKDTMNKTFTLYNPQFTTFNFPTVCQNQQAKITANSNLDGDQFKTWSWTGGGSTSTTDTLKFTSATTGKYEITVNATTNNGCKMSLKDSVTIWAIPVADFTINPVCFGKNLVPVDKSTIGNGEVISGYLWYLNGTLASSVKSPTLTGATVGNNTVRLNVSSTKGCTNSKVQNVEVYPLPKASFTYQDTCLNDLTSFNSTSTVSSGSLTSINWEYNDAVQDAGSSVSRTFSAPAEYSMKLVVVTNNGCRDSIIKTFSIAPLPVIDISASPTSGCQPFRPSFTNNSSISSGSIASYSWDFGDGNSATGVNPGHTYTVPGSYSVTVDAVSNAGCKSSLATPINIDVLAKPTAAFSFTPDEPSLLNPDISFINESSADATSFDWALSNGATFTSKDVDYTFPQPGDYIAILIATAGNGCKDTISKAIHVKRDFFVHAPTAFSPNGDLVNDRFSIYGMFDGVQGYSMEIFNRWGETIYKSENPIESWDGTYKGNPVALGSYPYMVRFRNAETGRWQTISGVIHIIR